MRDTAEQRNEVESESSVTRWKEGALLRGGCGNLPPVLAKSKESDEKASNKIAWYCRAVPRGL